MVAVVSEYWGKLEITFPYLENKNVVMEDGWLP